MEKIKFENNVMLYPNYIVRRPDNHVPLACTIALDDAKRIKEQFDKEDRAYAVENFGREDYAFSFEIYDTFFDKVIVEGNCP